MKSLLLIIFVCLSTIAYAQDESYSLEEKAVDTIRFDNSFGVPTYYKGWVQRLSLRTIQDIVKDNKQASKYMHTARGQHITAGFLVFFSGFSLGYGTFKLIIDGEVSPAFFIAGGPLLAGAIIFEISANKKVKKAVHLYNNDLLGRQVSSVNPSLNLGFTGNGVALVLHF